MKKLLTLFSMVAVILLNSVPVIAAEPDFYTYTEESETPDDSVYTLITARIEPTFSVKIPAVITLLPEEDDLTHHTGTYSYGVKAHLPDNYFVKVIPIPAEFSYEDWQAIIYSQPELTSTFFMHLIQTPAGSNNYFNGDVIGGSINHPYTEFGCFLESFLQKYPEDQRELMRNSVCPVTNTDYSMVEGTLDIDIEKAGDYIGGIKFVIATGNSTGNPSDISNLSFMFGQYIKSLADSHE